MDFKLHAPFSPTGDQPQAIEKLTEGVLDGIVTGILQLNQFTHQGVALPLHTRS